MAPIFLLSPTTPTARILAVGRLARGYVYYVSLKGVTGAGHLDTDAVAALVAATRTRFTLQRSDERAGTVRVHFPRIGYVLKAAQPA